jgi:hypothetical protein
LCGRKNFDKSQKEDNWHLLAIFHHSDIVDEHSEYMQWKLLDIVDEHSEYMQTHRLEVVENSK